MKVICISGKAQCVDAQTEFFNGCGWKKISDYTQGDKVLQYNRDGTASLVYPDEYISNRCDYLWEFENTRTSQCLTDEHRCYYITSKGKLYSKTAKEIVDAHNNTQYGFQGRFITTFSYGGEGIDLSDDEIKLMCAVICDSSFIKDTNKCFLNLKKERKKIELRSILHNLNIHWDERIYDSMPGYTRFVFEAPRREKEFSEFWYGCSHVQLKIICDNICKWDGYTKNGKPKSFSTTSLKTAEFLQFAYACNGMRVSISVDERPGKKPCYNLSISENTLVSLFNRETKKSDNLFRKIVPVDGKCYCFSVPSGMLILRRNRKIFITGNSGKDTSANILKMMLESDGYKVLIAHYADLLKYICKNYFDWNGEKDVCGRSILQHIGTDVIRRQNPDYWVSFIADILKFFDGEWDYVLIPDCRFPNEIDYLRSRGFDIIHIRVIRQNFTSPLTTEQQNHPSETALDNVLPDYYINNYGTLNALSDTISGLITEINGCHQLSFAEIGG